MLPELSVDVSLGLREGVGDRVRVRSLGEPEPWLRPRLWLWLWLWLCRCSVVECARGRAPRDVEPFADGYGVLPACEYWVG